MHLFTETTLKHPLPHLIRLVLTFDCFHQSQYTSIHACWSIRFDWLTWLLSFLMNIMLGFSAMKEQQLLKLTFVFIIFSSSSIQIEFREMMMASSLIYGQEHSLCLCLYLHVFLSLFPFLICIVLYMMYLYCK